MSVKSKPAPKRPKSPIPAPRSAQTSADVGKGIQSTPACVKSNASVADFAIQMGEEILQYRMNLKERSSSHNKECSDTPNKDNPECSGTDDVASIKRELQDAIEKNSQWQIYNDQREEYVKDLIEKYNQLHHRFHDIHESYTQLTNNPDRLSDHQRRYFDGLLVQARQELGTSHEETAKLRRDVENLTSKLREETQKLQEKIGHWRAMYEQEKEVCARLREERDKTARRKSGSSDANKENRDRIVSLQREMELYREDFRSERKKTADLERRLDRFQRTMTSDLSIPQNQGQPSSRSKHGVHDSKLKSTHREYNYKDSVSSAKLKKFTAKYESVPKSHKERRSHPVESVHVITRARRAKDTKNYADEDTLRLSDRMNKTYSEFGHSEDSNLCCPNCGKVYGVDEHEFLLNHIDSCM